MTGGIRDFLGVVFFFSIAAQLTAQAGELGSPLPKLSIGHLPVPIIRQSTDYSCGCAAFVSVAQYWGTFSGFESEACALLGATPENGTPPRGIVRGATMTGLTAETRENLTYEDLRGFLREGKTVILDIQAWRDNEKKKSSWAELWEEGHYVVLIDMDSHYAYFMDPSAPHDADYTYIPLSELAERWRDYEIENGKELRNFHLGIIIRGTEPAKNGPRRLVPTE